MAKGRRQLRDADRFPGFVPLAEVHGIFGVPKARIVHLRRRRKKTVCGQCGTRSRSFYDRRPWVARDLSCGLLQGYLEFEIRRVGCPHCGVKREKLDWLANNPFYAKRFAYYVGRRCRDSTLKAIAEELDWDWKTVKDLDKQYLREQLRRVG
jgi:transposase